MTPPSELLVTASKLHLRKGPFVENNILGTFERGDIVQLLATKELWSEVRLGTRRGWVSSKYLCAPSLYPVALGERETYPWMPIAIAQIGESEIEGFGSNPRILDYLRSCELDQGLALDDTTPWCSAAVNWCVELAGYAGTNSARAKSWLDWGYELRRPVRGCITVLSRPPAGGPNGHVGFFVERSRGQVTLLGGNQGNRFGLGLYDESRLLGFRVAQKAGTPRKAA